jgi:hypothetical protein
LNAKVQNIQPRFVQLDEMWGFIHTKEHNLGFDDPEEWGSFYLWLGMDSETKLRISHHVGARNGLNAFRFIFDIRERTIGRYLITSDQFKPYLTAIREWFGTDTDPGRFTRFTGKSVARLVWLWPRFGRGPTRQNWQTGRAPHFDFSYRTGEFECSYASSSPNEAYKCIQQKTVESSSRRHSLYRLLQLLPCPPDLESYACDGGRTNRPRLEHRRAVDRIKALREASMIARVQTPSCRPSILLQVCPTFS